MIDPTIIVTIFFTSFFLGSLYAMIAMGLSLIYGAVRLLNFAHGAIMVTCGYTTWIFFTVLGLPFSVSVVLAVAFNFLIGVGLELIMRPIRGVKGWVVTTITITTGISMVIQNTIRGIFGARARALPSMLTGGFALFGFTVTYNKLAIGAISILVLILMWLYLKRTDYGRAIRAVSQDMVAAKLMGIDVNRVYILTFGISCAMAGIAGSLLGSVLFITPTMGIEPMLKAFVIVVFGGIGSIKGTLYACYILGLVEAITSLVFGLSWVLPVEFGFMIAVLIIRPRGLFGEEEI